MYYWKDIEADSGEWTGLTMYIQDKKKPTVRLESGANGRIQFVHNDSIIFWATIVHDYYGAWLLKNKPANTPPLVENIRSTDIEDKQHLSAMDKLKAWTRWFITALNKEPTCLLYEGLWILKPYRPIKPKQWQYKAIKYSIKDSQRSINEVERALDEDNIIWIDWWTSGSGAVIGTRNVDQHSGRIKWWRKKIRENNLPPILIWYVSCLDAHIILDGHERMMASYLEGVAPDILVLYSACETPINPNKKVQTQIIDSLINQTEKRLRPIPTSRVNEVLVQAFDNRPFISRTTKSWASIESESIWLDQVSSRLHSIGKSDWFDNFEKRYD